MIALQANRLTKYFGGNRIFENVQFQIDCGERVALIGPNGSGKTTLFRCLLGLEQYDAGDLHFGKDLSIGYLEQIHDIAEDVSIWSFIQEAFADVLDIRQQMQDIEKNLTHDDESILHRYAALREKYERKNGDAIESFARGVLTGLGFQEDDYTRLWNSLSGGEKTRLSLARLLVKKYDFLFLDEPTNHLDVQSIEWLEGHLSRYDGTLFIVSHDRYFLDRIATKTMELSHHSLQIFKGNYSDFMKKKEEQNRLQHLAFEKQQRHIKETEAYIEKYRAGIKSKQARGRQKQLDRLERLSDIDQDKTISLLRIAPEESANDVLHVRNLTKAYGKRALFQHLDFDLFKGEKVGLVGANGTGKSTFLHLLEGHFLPDEGTITWGHRVYKGYYDQEHSGLDQTSALLESLTLGYDIPISQAKNILASLLFKEEDWEKRIHSLSGGQKGRIALLHILLSEPNVLVLDEPTNHMDIASKTVIEHYLKDYNGTMLVVSHDRYFLDNICDRIVELSDQKMTSYMGNYTYYRQKKEEKALRLKEEKIPTIATTEPLAKKQKASSNLSRSKLRAELQKLEDAISLLEKEKEEITSKMADVVADYVQLASLTTELQELEIKLDDALIKWTELNETLEQIT